MTVTVMVLVLLIALLGSCTFVCLRCWCGCPFLCLVGLTKMPVTSCCAVSSGRGRTSVGHSARPTRLERQVADG